MSLVEGRGRSHAVNPKRTIGIATVVATLGLSSTAFAAGRVGRPGQTLTGVKIDRQRIFLTISNLVDPARDTGGYNTDTQGDVPQNDDHFATAELRVKNKGNSTISSGSLSVIAYDQSEGGGRFQALPMTTTLSEMPTKIFIALPETQLAPTQT